MIRLIKNTIIFLPIFVTTLIALDLFIRYAGISQVLIYSYDSIDGRVFSENAEYLMTTEGFAMGKINEYGYIGPGYGNKKTPGKLRIALLGDSYVEGFQHFDRNHFRAVMEKELKEKYGVEAEVMNFGRFGYNLLNNYTLSESLVERFKPDISLIFLSAEDVWDTTVENRLPRPIILDSTLAIDLPPYNRAPNFSRVFNRETLSRHSPTVMMIRNCMTLAGKGETAGILFGKFSSFFNNMESSTEEETTPLSPIGKKILEELAQNNENIIVYREKQSLSDSEINAITETGIKFISLSSTLNNDGIYFTDKNGNEGHWNIQGHQLIGKYLAAKIAGITRK